MLKSGGAYVPIDPEYPQDRINYMLSDSQCKVVIDEQELECFKKEEKKYSIKKLKSKNNPGHLVYVIYTSGSTGKPKGVMVEDRGVTNLIYCQTKEFNITETEKVLQFSNYCFDASVEQIFLALFNGASLILIAKDLLLNTSALEAFIQEHRITHLHTTPGFLETINPASCKVLKRVIAGGEACRKGLREKWAGVADFYNEYGPTETTVTVIEYCCPYNSLAGLDVLPIGKPLSNNTAYILTESLSLCPKGVMGEICIGGAGLARGYLNQDALTKEKFISNPFRAGERLYKTGDLGRWLPDGNIEFIGRKDDQVKINGYRIELGEIEQVLQSHKEIEEVVVLAKENQNNEKELVAYLISKSEQKPGELRNYLKEILPEYMLPAHYVQLEALPLSSNGKIDRKVLPDPQGLGLKSGIEYIAPGNEIEEKLEMIWQEVLGKGKEKLGIDEGFFTVGGNSIKLIALQSKIERGFKTSCPVALLFQYSTIRQQADMLLQGNSVEINSVAESDRLASALQEESSVEGNTDIAVIGMSIKAPGSKNIQEFWKNLRDGKESVTHFSREELLSFGISEDTLNNENYVRANSHLEDKECFDSDFFGYIPDEAKTMDPQTRVFHEVVWSALEDAGYDPIIYKGWIGLYAGAASNIEWEVFNHISDAGIVDDFSASQLSDKDFSNTLIAHKLNLNGSVNAINTACSTSLVAIHHAVRSILTGENHMAIAGGVSIRNSEKEKGYFYREGMIASKDGHNRAFDINSSGTIGGEGAGAVVLKRLSAAKKDGDQIYAIIKGSAVNNDGNRKVGYTAPSVDGQSEVIRLAHRVANVSPESISYVEAHGTATKLGDPIEVLALTRAFGKSVNKYCALGSVKTNIGHLDTAAGVAGFIKTVLCLKNKELVPSLHFESPNPEINFEESPFYVNTQLKEWSRGDFPRRAGVSSFGIGGTNAHVILEEAQPAPAKIKDPSLQIIALSAKTSGALARQQENLKEFLIENKNVNLVDVSWTLQNRQSFPYRASFVAQTVDQAIECLEKNEGIKSQSGKIQGEGKKKIAFLFPGGGSQYQNMGLGLYEMKESVFRKTMNDCFEIAEKLSDINFKNILYPDNPGKNNEINEIINALPLLFMFEYSLAKQIEYYGIEPDVMIGHSMGEYVAACFAGSLTVEGALKMSIKRGELMQELPKGAMMAVEISSDKIGDYLSDRVDLAAVNSPTSCVISGYTDSIVELSERFEQEGISAKILHISHASHSIMMEPMLDEFTEAIRDVDIQPSKIPYISNLTGLHITSKELSDKKYWSRHLRNTVKFSRGIKEVLSHDNTIFIEVGPGNSLGSFARQQFKKGTSAEVHQLIRQPKTAYDDKRFLFDKISDLWRSGLEIRWPQLNNESIKNKISLPTYAFERTRYPMGDVMKVITKKLEQFNEEKRLEESEWYYEPSWRKSKLPQQGDLWQEGDWCLVFSDEGDIGKKMTYSPEISSDKIITIKGGSCYRKINEFEFELNPYEYEGYEKLFSELHSEEIHPKHIVHLLTLDQHTQTETSQENIERNKAFGFYSLLHIAKELNKMDNQLPINLSVITNNLESVFDGETIHPSKALIAGILIVMSQENPAIQGRLIDISLESSRGNVLTELAREVKSDVREKFLAYRNGIRWVKHYNSLTMPSIEKTQSKIKHGGTYLIIGGLGNLGFIYSKYLQEKYKANLILVGRSNISTSGVAQASSKDSGTGNNELKRKERLQLLQENGNAVYYNANISDFASMKQVVESAEIKFGEINGVIHTAAIVGREAFVGVNFLSVAECEKQFDPKMNGIQVIEELFRNRELDFCLFTSSLASIIGGKEFGAYAPACAYMDYFSCARRIKNCVSANFGSFNFGEPKLGPAPNQPDALNQTEIVKVLEVLLLADDPQILVSPVQLENRIKKWVYPKPDNKLQITETPVASINVERFNLSAVYSPPKSKTEVELCYMFEEFFGKTEIGIDDNFFELGGNSLKAMTLIYRIHKKSNIRLKIRDVFEHSSIKELAKKIDLLTGITHMQEEQSTMNFENKIEL
ncbi:polyketide synthase [Niastella populi]|uniref:polyketide synthase n=1 Tax=Niastella populi TaxID=550983 RepID=UPI002418A534|nr:polyketide synthase [Niastella populi]